MFEHKSESLLTRAQFTKRLVLFLLASLCVLFLALGIGVLGYRYICELSWIDAFLNASMILTGMGPVNIMNTFSAKVFASLYALFSGVIFLTSAGILIAPVFHRIVHRIHLDDL